MAAIINHPSVKRQKPRIILVTPPPINEHLCVENDKAKGYSDPRRTADHTRLYADAAKEVARNESVALLDLYGIFIENAGGVRDDHALPGSLQTEPNPFIRMLLHDGE